MMEYQIIALDKDLWSIEQRGVRSFLFAGEDKAVLIDSCFGGDLLSVCKTLTEQPITLITTHADIDHIGSDTQFPDHYMHPAEFDRYHKPGAVVHTVLPLWEGKIISVGAYKLEVVLIPGHTPGSIALLERNKRFLISGDSVQDGCIYMHGNGRCLPALNYSLHKLNRLRLAGAFDTVYASHGTVRIPADIIEDHLMLVQGVLDASLVPIDSAPERFPDSVKVYGFGRVKMYYDPTVG